MQIYLVGGAVRDKLLGLPIKERDWVVVGATPADLLKQGYRQVGKDFPVFLHPTTNEEYALARTERKSGHGYKGFQVYADASVTLEEDLRRRDLTINAMAEDESGQIIDPYHGQRDLANKKLRHVSEAFTEDPLRLLRLARFKARFHPFQFSIAAETHQLLLQMVRAGEVSHLVRDRVWLEVEKTLATQHPEQFFQVLRNTGALRVLFPELDALFGVPNPPIYHPEIDSGVHTLLVLARCSEISSDPAVRFASLLHDLGKATTLPNNWPSHNNHSEAGLIPIKNVCERYPVPKEMTQLASLVAKYHIRAHRIFDAPVKEVLAILTGLDVYRRPHRLEQFIAACTADIRGRHGHENALYPQGDKLRMAFDLTQAIDVATIISQGATGANIGIELEKMRLSILQKQFG